MSATELAVGVDLGTTSCCVAHLDEHGVVKIIADSKGYKLIPSHVAKTVEGYLIGKLAKEEHPDYAVYDSKRLIGRTFDDPCIQNNLKSWPFKVKSQDNLPLMEVEVRSTVKSEKNFVRPEEISAELLRHMKQIAEEYFRREVKNAVVTVPAHFGYHQRMATKEAAKLAGLNVLGLINEPSAAALAYIHKHKIRGEKHLLVVDLGGGTFDISIVKVNSTQVNIIATAGSTDLGGRDFDRNLADLIYEKLTKRYEVEDLPDVSRRRIGTAIENLKIRLSKIKSAMLELSNVLKDVDVELNISRSEFEEANLSLFDTIMNTMTRCLEDAKLSKSQIDEVVLVGGSTKIPKIQQLLKEFFGKPLSKSISPHEAVAYGAAVQTAKFNNKEEVFKIVDVAPLSLGIGTSSNIMCFFISRNTPIPVSAVKRFSTAIDKQPDVGIKIFEGERPLASANTCLGTCKLELPSEPPGYAFDIILDIDGNGLLHVSAREGSGRYTQLSIEYKPPDANKVGDIIQEHSDQLRCDVINAKHLVLNYCEMLKVVCNHDHRYMTEEDKSVIVDLVSEAKLLFKDNNHSPKTDTNLDNIKAKTDFLVAVCESILSKYGYPDIRDVWPDFHQMIKKIQIDCASEGKGESSEK